MIKDQDNDVTFPETNGSFFAGSVTKSTKCRLLRLIQRYEPGSDCSLAEPVEQIVLEGVSQLLGSLARKISEESAKNSSQMATNKGLFRDLLVKVIFLRSILFLLAQVGTFRPDQTRGQFY